MDIQNITDFISGIGIPGAILIYLVWRFDKFLTFLCRKLDIYNEEFADIGSAIYSLVTELKDLKKEVLDFKNKLSDLPKK